MPHLLLYTRSTGSHLLARESTLLFKSAESPLENRMLCLIHLHLRNLKQNPLKPVTGTDFTGALYMYVRAAEGERKVYLCPFTCAVSQAFHLEVVTDLTVESHSVDLLDKDLFPNSYYQIMAPHAWRLPRNSRLYFHLLT